ncbi:hypothetical protein Zm00014a_043368 [Zea mays]|uniref:Uncharacterized protein n=1 Tax=Zea mays TaxID=4577 RepID=A0A3L6DC96_MAIZE|nr:hypothetical protein Zm00014a_043368 [Zea mays]
MEQRQMVGRAREEAAQGTEEQQQRPSQREKGARVRAQYLRVEHKVQGEGECYALCVRVQLEHAERERRGRFLESVRVTCAPDKRENVERCSWNG